MDHNPVYKSGVLQIIFSIKEKKNCMDVCSQRHRGGDKSLPEPITTEFTDIHYKVWDEIIYPFPNWECLGMDKSFHPILYWTGDYLSMLGMKLTHFSKMGPILQWVRIFVSKYWRSTGGLRPHNSMTHLTSFYQKENDTKFIQRPTGMHHIAFCYFVTYMWCNSCWYVFPGN